jgi:hypothetical protein
MKNFDKGAPAMLKDMDIVHGGLRDIFQTTTTANPEPPTHLHRFCYRALYGLRFSTSFSDPNMAGIKVIAVPGTSACEIPMQNNKITFQWNNGHALVVDWA